MNLWKASTIVLAGSLATLVGRDAFDRAAAATSAARPSAVAFDWGQEQPHMEQALRDLRGARHSLEVAAEHKGGWRVLALKHTDEAINETIRGIEYAKAHPRD
ncbi:MAG TPA: hypothetical protein VE987_08280 [Polyangiaceae bacterium]|nr:hypothetical protein [Polyangiaceae bacterium]